MSKIDWRMKRGHYCFASGILVAIAAKLNFPGGALVGFALFALITAMRFKTLGWKSERAFAPLAVAAGGALIGLVLNDHSPSGGWVATQSHAAALWAQIIISIRAGLSFAPGDPIPRKVALARDLRAKRRQLIEAIKEAKPHREAFQREIELLKALNAERAAQITTPGYVQTPESQALADRIAVQLALIERLGDEARGQTEAKTAELNAALQSWRDRNKREAA